MPQVPTGQSSYSNIRYFKCGKLGHQTTDYRKLTNQKGKNLLIEDEVVVETKEIGEPVYDDKKNGDVLFGR